MKPAAIGAALLTLALMSNQPAAAQTSSTTSTAPNDRKLELARELVKASGSEATMVSAFHAMAQQMTASMGANLTAERQARLKVIDDAQGDILAKMVPSIEQAMETGYAQTFTEQELSDMLAFYRSPSGRSMVSKMPQFTQGITAEMVRLAPQMRRDMGKEVCVRITCTPAEKSAFFGSAAAKSAPSSASPATPPPPNP